MSTAPINMTAARLNILTAERSYEIALSPEQRRMALTDLLRRHQIVLNTRCGGRGLCDGCMVHASLGQFTHLKTRQANAGTIIRACEHALAEDAPEAVTLSVPARSMLAYEPQVVSSFKVNISRSHDPLWQTITLTPADMADGDVTHAISIKLDEPASVEPPLAGQIASALQTGPVTIACELLDGGWQATAILGSPPGAPLGVAIDIGTTTVALLIAELATGKVVASTSGFNRQMHLGDDVLTRINLCSTDVNMLQRLQQAVVKDTIERLLIKALKDSQITDERIACLTIAANTTMLHLLAGVDPTPMGIAPFKAAFLGHKTLRASDIHLRLSSPATAPDGQTSAAADPAVHLLPSASAYVGADITAGAVSCGLVYDRGPGLLVDVGTNGEILLRHNNRMWATATAAGPAFEGSRMACGMRAGNGAISHIRMNRTDSGIEVECDVIGDVKPTGLCGSAYIDFIAQARKVGLLSSAGRFEQIADARLAPYRDYGKCFAVARGHGNEPIVISEYDIASLLQAKAAIAAGILTLLSRIGIRPDEIRTLYLAGGFGMHMDIPNTIASGLLPGFRPEQIQLVGNTSLAGAYLSMLDCGVLMEIRRLAQAVEIVELNLDPEFENCYIDQLSLP